MASRMQDTCIFLLCPSLMLSAANIAHDSRMAVVLPGTTRRHSSSSRGQTLSSCVFISLFLLLSIILFMKVMHFSRKCLFTKGKKNLFWIYLGLPRCASGKEPNCQCRRHSGSGSIPGSGRSPRGGMATHSSILAWRIPWTDGAWREKPFSGISQ